MIVVKTERKETRDDIFLEVTLRFSMNGNAITALRNKNDNAIKYNAEKIGAGVMVALNPLVNY